MASTVWWRSALVVAGFLAAPAYAFADDPCDGLLATLDRPTVADSACVVKAGKLLAELGFQDALVKGTDQRELAFGPQAELRYGLPHDWEIKLFPPSENEANLRDVAGGGRLTGLGDTSFGVKHQFGTFDKLTVAADAKLTVPTGTTAFGDGGVEGNVQAIVAYAVTDKLGVSFQIGASSLTDRGNDGLIRRYASANPDIVVSYQLNSKLQLYGEVFGNTKSAPQQRGNVSFDGGIQYLLTKTVEVDAEAGTLLAGPQGQQARYFGFGTGLLF